MFERKLLGLLVCLSFAIASLALNDVEWQEYKQKFNKNYARPSLELKKRQLVAKEKALIDEHNAKPHNSIKLKLNQMSDISLKEYQANLRLKPSFTRSLMRKRNDLNSERYLREILESVPDKDVPESVDWRQSRDRVTPVKDQAGCQASYAFAAIGALEGQMAVRDRNLTSLSEQNIIDCSKRNQGCQYGYVDEVFWYVLRERGIQDSESYPYVARKEDCSYDRSKSVFIDAGAVLLKPGDEQELKKVVAVFGPVAVNIDTSTFLFKTYESGIFYDKDCVNIDIQCNRSALVVGYGTSKDEGGDFWLIKNSWGTSWGEDGYIRIARNKDNHCGVATKPMIPKFE